MEQQAQPPPAKSLPVDRLRDYLRQLAPAAQALLMREFERAVERGEDVAVANFVLTELRQIVRADGTERPRAEDASRLVFACLGPFLIDEGEPRPGQIRRSSLEPVWLWLSKAAVVDAAAELGQTLSAGGRRRSGGPQVSDRRIPGDRGGDIAGIARRRPGAQSRAGRVADRGRGPSRDRHHLCQP